MLGKHPSSSLSSLPRGISPHLRPPLPALGEEAAQYRTRWQDEKGPVTRTRLNELSDQAATRDPKK